jgi:hypothetical protein
VERRTLLHQRYCSTRQTDAASRLTPGPSGPFYTRLSSASHLFRPKTPKQFISEFF